MAHRRLARYAAKSHSQLGCRMLADLWGPILNCGVFRELGVDARDNALGLVLGSGGPITGLNPVPGY